MNLPINEMFSIIKTFSNAKDGWIDLLAACKLAEPNAPWHQLPTLDVERDVTSALNWLKEELDETNEPIGVYLGLDTLNMEDGDGTNVEFGYTQACDTSSDSSDWVYNENLKYGNNHLIYGLFELKKVYQTAPWSKFASFCDYILFLGYSGIVFADAFRKLPKNNTMLVAWGFHDGDILTLGRKSSGAFTPICLVE